MTIVDTILGFVLNFIVYEIVLFGFYSFTAVVLMDDERLSVDKTKRITDAMAAVCFIIMIILIVLYLTGIFRLIPV